MREAAALDGIGDSATASAIAAGSLQFNRVVGELSGSLAIGSTYLNDLTGPIAEEPDLVEGDIECAGDELEQGNDACLGVDEGMVDHQGVTGATVTVGSAVGSDEQ